MAIYKVTTEGDCEGKSTRTLGLFSGTKHQAIAYLKVNGNNPYYHYRIQKVDVVDVSSLNIGDFRVTEREDGKVLMHGRLPSALLDTAKREKALAKLTKEEREILGV